MALGAPAEKLLLGFPTYGRTYRLSSSATSLGAPANGPADAGPYTRTAGFWAFYEVKHIHSHATMASAFVFSDVKMLLGEVSLIDTCVIKEPT